jgi:putative nucleotidyltransferase with HDIG domain
MIGSGRQAAPVARHGLKKVAIKQLRLGMYVEQLCCSWIDTPFWQSSFLIESPAQLERIAASRAVDAWIDTERGLDVVPAPENSATASAAPPPAAGPAFRFRTPAHSTMEDELGRAAVLLNASKRALCDMFNEARMGCAVEMRHAMPLVESIANSVLRNPGALIGLARLKTADNYTYMHSVAVCALMIALARQMGLDDHLTRELGLAGLLHDVGKMAIPAEVLNKPGSLTEDEFCVVRGHPEKGHAMLLASPDVGPVALEVCLHHHERPDGRGYPHRLSGDALGLYARMGAVCDVYDAITSNRPYKAGWCPAESLRRMAEWARAGQFDEAVFAAFVKCLGIYPVGTLVRLQSGRLGVVAEQPCGKSLLMPKIKVFFSTRARAYIRPELIDLAAPGARDAIVGCENAADWGLHDIDHHWLGDSVAKTP